MKIFSWMQSKLNANQKSSKRNALSAKDNQMHDTCKAEFSDWPGGLLSIGTFGNNNLKDPENSNVVPPDQDHPEVITHEEVRELHKELRLLANKQSHIDSELDEESANDNVPPEKFFDFLQTLEDDRSTSKLISYILASEEGHTQGSTNSVSQGKECHFDKKNNIGKRSLSFLLRKEFHRISKSKLSPLLKDPLPELKLEKSRLEKILRAILNKKIYPQSSNPKAATNKCLDKKQLTENDSEDEMIENTIEGSKWVKTDSDFIVLEI